MKSKQKTNFGVVNKVDEEPLAVEGEMALGTGSAQLRGADTTTLQLWKREASTTSYATPTITPPSSSNNPYVWRSTLPTGTVFIAVGAVAGLLLAIFVLVLLLKRARARRAATRSVALAHEDPFIRHQGLTSKADIRLDDYDDCSNYSGNSRPAKQVKIPLLNQNLGPHQDLASVGPGESEAEPEADDSLEILEDRNAEFFSTLDNDKRRSMFVSPTAEIMGHVGHNTSTSRLTPLKKERSVSPERRGRLEELDNRSYDDFSTVKLASPERSASSSPQRKAHRAVPSIQLESMFEE